MTNEIAIKCSNLSKMYQMPDSTSKGYFNSFFTKKKSFAALDDVSFEIKKGESIGIIGKNGAGKSTLLKILSRITYPTIGSIEINGKLTALLEVGTGFHPELTGRENIYLNGSLLGMNKKEINEKLDEIVDFSGVGEFIDMPVKNYSSGMVVRLGFSVAANLNSDIILLDEVLAVGDAEFQNKCKMKIAEFQNSDKTILLVSHDIGLIKAYANKTMLIEEGKVTYFGDTVLACKKYLAESKPAFGKVIKDAKAKYINKQVVIEVEYEFHYKPMEVNLGVVLFNEKLHPITGTNMVFEKHFQRFSISNESSGKIEATSDLLNLANGTYYITLWMSDLNKEIDRLDYILSLNVNDSINVISNTGSIRTSFNFKNINQ